MVNFNLENVVKALIDEVVKFYKKDNNYHNMLLTLKTAIDTYVKQVGYKLSLLSRGTFHQYFYKTYGDRHPLSPLMQQIANHDHDIKTKTNQLLTFDLNIKWLDEYLTSKFEENINNNSLTKEQLSTLCNENGIFSYNNSSLENAINNALLERETKNFCEQCLNNISNCCGLCG